MVTIKLMMLYIYLTLRGLSVLAILSLGVKVLGDIAVVHGIEYNSPNAKGQITSTTALRAENTSCRRKEYD